MQVRRSLRRATTKVLELVHGSTIKPNAADAKAFSDDILFINAKNLYYKGELLSSQVCFEKLKASLDVIENALRIDEINNYLSNIYSKVGKDSITSCNYISALTYFEKLKSLKELKGDKKAVSDILLTIADIYQLSSHASRTRGNLTEAILNMEKRKSILQEQNKSLAETSNELEELYSMQARKYYHCNKLKRAIASYEKLREIYDRKNNSKGLLELYGILGKLYLDTNQIRTSIQYFTKLKDLAEVKQDFKKKMHAFQHLGICFQLMKDYTTALTNFKLLLQLAWKEENIEMELIAYDYMSLAYFYEGDLEGARYYHNRTWKGITEKFASPVREISNKALEACKSREKIQSMGNLDRMSSIRKGNRKDVPNLSLELGLPSPRTSSGITDQQLLPVYPIASTPIVKDGRRNKIQRTSTAKHLNKTVEVKLSKLDTNTKSLKPFILISHLSPIESVKNFLYYEQINNHK